MIFAETDRLRLRALEERDLPRLPEFLNDWDVVKWLIRVPFPYAINDAVWWFNKVQEGYKAQNPDFMVIAKKEDDALMGGIGAHASTIPDAEAGCRELGYWLGRPYWSQGYMSEAVVAALSLGFTRHDVTKIIASTDPANQASQNVLRKAGLRYLGIHPRKEQNVIRGSDQATYWEITREEFEKFSNKNN